MSRTILDALSEAEKATNSALVDTDDIESLNRLAARNELDRLLRNHAADLIAAGRTADRLLYIAEHLFQMVPQSVWRDHGADDMQGHYEGDYHAEKLREELSKHRAALAPLLADTTEAE